MEDLKLVPLTAYMKTESDCTPASMENTIKLWTLVKYMTQQPGEEPRLETAEFCIFAEAMPDFCGGLLFYSPQMTTYYHGAVRWDGNDATFCHLGRGVKLSCTWDDLVKDPDRAVCLEAFTGKEIWTPTEVTEYAYKSIAQSCITELLRCGTHGWAAADTVDGHMHTVHRHMSCYSDVRVPVNHPIFMHSVQSSNCGGQCLREVSIKTITTSAGVEQEYHNVNSGNEVLWLTGIIESRGCRVEPDQTVGVYNDDCDGCGDNNGNCDCGQCHQCGCGVVCYSNSEHTSTLGGQIKRTYDNPLFMQQARRYIWSNG